MHGYFFSLTNEIQKKVFSFIGCMVLQPILYFTIRNYSEVHVISYIDLDRNIFLIAAEMVNIFNKCFCFKVIVIHLLFTESYPSIPEMQKLLRISPHASCLFTSLIASSAFSHVLLPSCTQDGSLLLNEHVFNILRSPHFSACLRPYLLHTVQTLF